MRHPVQIQSQSRFKMQMVRNDRVALHAQDDQLSDGDLRDARALLRATDQRICIKKLGPRTNLSNVKKTQALIGLSRVTQVSTATLVWAYVLWPLSALGVTAGVHRLWSHRAHAA